MKLMNISNGKIIGVGNVSILPGETKEVPQGFENHPTLRHYESMGLALLIGKEVQVEEGTVTTTTKKRGRKSNAESAESLRKARLASLDGITDEALARLAQDLGLNPADCIDMADMLSKVKVLLQKK